MNTTNTTKTADAGSKNWLKERAAISAAHRRQKTDPAAARLIEKADQLHKERTQKNLRDSVDEDDEALDEVPETATKNEGRDRRTNVKSSFRRSALFSSTLNHSSTPAEEEDLEDIDAIVSVPPPQEVVVKIAQKSVEEDPIVSNHGKEASEDVFRSFAESVLELGLTTKSELELSFDLKPEDIKRVEEEEEDDEDEDEDEEDGEEKEEGEEEEKDEEKEEEKEETQEEQADADEADEADKTDKTDNTEERVQESADIGINHSEEIEGDVKVQVEDDELNKKEESTLTEEVKTDAI